MRRLLLLTLPLLLLTACGPNPEDAETVGPGDNAEPPPVDGAAPAGIPAEDPRMDG